MDIHNMEHCFEQWAEEQRQRRARLACRQHDCEILRLVADFNGDIVWDLHMAAYGGDGGRLTEKERLALRLTLAQHVVKLETIWVGDSTCCTIFWVTEQTDQLLMCESLSQCFNKDRRDSNWRPIALLEQLRHSKPGITSGYIRSWQTGQIAVTSTEPH